MIDSADGAMMAYEAVFPDLDASPVLKRTSHIYECAGANAYVLSAVGMEWREVPKDSSRDFPVSSDMRTRNSFGVWYVLLISEVRRRAL